jgi:hypothetical protein
MYASTHSLPARVTISPDVLFQHVEGQTVLLDLAGECYYSLDDVGTRIWDLLTKYDQTSTVLEHLRAVYAVDAGTLGEDLAIFLGKLVEAKLVRIPETQAS